MEPIVRAAMEAAARGDRDALRVLLHPYVRWHSAPGVTLSGRNRVLAMLIESPPPRPPTACELRDGQIYRWTAAG